MLKCKNNKSLELLIEYKSKKYMKTIIIFGATGSVGAYTTISLKRLGYNIIAVAHRKNDNNFFEQYGIQYYSVDIVNAEAFKKLPQHNIDIVLHFAGMMPARMEGYNPYLYVDTIIKGTLNVLEYTKKIGAEKIVFTQSIADVLYKFGKVTPIDPYSVRRNPLTGDHAVYSISKNTAVNLIEYYHAEFGIKRFILRLPTIYVYQPNPYYFVNGKKKVIAYRYLIHQAMEGEDIELWGDPNSKKDIVYVKDFVQMIEKCILSNLEGGIYNVGTGIGVSMQEQIEGMIKVFHPVNKISKIKYRPDMPSSPQYILDITNARIELGYRPCYSYISYLEDFKKEMEQNPFEKIWGKPLFIMDEKL
jgi:UDP-glucose 4-epimerase